MRPALVVLHYTGMASVEAALELLCAPAARVSSHYLIAADGRAWLLVPETERAWHAGAGRWGEIEDVNSFSIGIELDNPGPLAGFPAFPHAQMAALEAVLRQVMARWSIPREGVIAHSDLAPRRKADPGPAFDWRRLAEAGLSIWPEAVGTAAPCWHAFRAAAARIGYRLPEGGEWEHVLAAFRLRFRPEAAGPLSGSDVAWAEAVASLCARDPGAIADATGPVPR